MFLFSPNEDLLALACKEVGISQQRLRDDVAILRDWLDRQPHLPAAPDDSFLVANMLLRCKGSVEATKKALDYYFSMRTNFPDFFNDRDPLSDEIQHLLDVWGNATLPARTADGCRVHFYVMSSPVDVCTHQMTSVAKLWMMCSDLELKEDVSLAEVFIHDMRTLSMAHIVRLTPTFVMQAFEVGSNGCKGRLKGIHFLNSPPVTDALVRLLKLVLPAKQAARVHVHSTLDSLHAHVDKAVLPADYGGGAKTHAELARDWRKTLESHRGWYLQTEDSWKVDEANRPQGKAGKDGCFGIEGTFKKLQVD